MYKCLEKRVLIRAMSVSRIEYPLIDDEVMEGQETIMIMLSLSIQQMPEIAMKLTRKGNFMKMKMNLYENFIFMKISFF